MTFTLLNSAVTTQKYKRTLVKPPIEGSFLIKKNASLIKKNASLIKKNASLIKENASLIKKTPFLLGGHLSNKENTSHIRRTLARYYPSWKGLTADWVLRVYLLD